MTTRFYFHLATNVTITPMSATFAVLSFVRDVLTKRQINKKEEMGLSREVCVAAGIELECGSQLFSG